MRDPWLERAREGGELLVFWQVREQRGERVDLDGSSLALPGVGGLHLDEDSGGCYPSTGVGPGVGQRGQPTYHLGEGGGCKD